jgi:hypothetical protein
MAASLAEGTCETCLNNGVNNIEDTREHCPINRKRGRPRCSHLRQQQLQQAQSMQPHTQTHMSQISQKHMYAGQGMHASLQVARAWQ